MAFSYNKKNLANTTITGAITPTQTSVTVADATVFSYAFFYATLMPYNEMSNASNSEIVLVTNIQGNTLTLVRGQENTIARSFPYGAVITNGIYTRDIDYARSIGRKVFMARDDGTDDTNTSYQIIDPMIKNVPEEGSIITVEFNVPSYGAPTLGVNNVIGGLVQVSGTDIHITDSSGQIDSVEMYGDTQQTTYSGKNLCDGINQEYWLTSAATGAGVSSGNSGLIIPVAQNTRYTISTTTSQTRYRVAFSDSVYTSTQLTCYNGANRDGTSDSITRGSETHSYLIVNATDLTKIQVEEGNQATPFEPYVGGTASPNPDYPQEVQTVTGEQTITVSNGTQSQNYPINLGKNILDNIGVTETKAGGITFTVNADKSVTVSGVATGANWFKLSDGLQLDGDYFLSGCPGVGSTTTFSLQTSYSGTVYGDYGSGVQLHAGTTDPVWIVIRQGQDFSTPVTFYPQIEKGTSKSSYAPYFTPIELCKIGTYQDYIYKSGDDWYVHKEVGKQDMSALSGLSVISTGNFIASSFASTYGSVIGTMLSNIFTYSDTGWEKAGKFGIAASGNMWAMTGDSTITTANISTWLSDRSAVVYYELATPTDTQITNATLIAQLNALYNMLPEGVADVVVTGDLPGSLTIKYYQQGTGTHTAPIVGGAEIDGGDNEQVVELDSYLPYRLVYDTNGYWRVLNKGPKVTTGAIMDGAVTPAKLSVDPGKYSTAETIIGSWIDGRPVYRKVLTGTTPEGGVTINHGISNFARILNVGGWVQSGSNGSQPIQRVVTDAITQYGIGVGDFNSTSFLLQVGTNGDIRRKPYTIILEYIKTV